MSDEMHHYHHLDLYLYGVKPRTTTLPSLVPQIKVELPTRNDKGR